MLHRVLSRMTACELCPRKLASSIIFAQADRNPPGLRSLMTVLERWFAYRGMPAGDQPIVTDLGCTPTKEAATLRADLKRAGIVRPQLFERSQYVEPLRSHDLRATFITWARRAGKDGSPQR